VSAILERIRARLFGERSRTAIEVKSLSCGYGKKKVVKNLSFKVRPREVYGIVGLSGSGKTTILRCVTGLMRYKGEVSVFGSKPSRVRRKMAYAPQDNAFFEEMTVMENIRLFGTMSGVSPALAAERGAKMLRQLTMGEHLHSFAGNLSGGQKKRLNIVLSLLHEPKLLVLDEPFAGLDYLNRRLLWEFIRSLRSKGKTVFLTTHLLDEAEENCSRILVLRDGKKFTAGYVREILRNRNIMTIVELRLGYLSEENLEKIERFCKKARMRVLDHGKRQLTVSLPHERPETLLNHLSKLRIKHKVQAVRPPSLDDLFILAAR
jgi:ABC-2 type transport system ATP-binding protein